jgi:hypothetical protein
MMARGGKKGTGGKRSNKLRHGKRGFKGYVSVKDDVVWIQLWPVGAI